MNVLFPFLMFLLVTKCGLAYCLHAQRAVSHILRQLPVAGCEIGDPLLHRDIKNSVLRRVVLFQITAYNQAPPSRKGLVAVGI